jgi:hypothetical protein
MKTSSTILIGNKHFTAIQGSISINEQTRGFS